MRLTIEVDDSDLRAIQRITGENKKSPAVSRALEEFLRQQKKQKLIDLALSGKTDYPLTNDELEERDVYEARG
jgi:Arc/MetJ family transcription regulator